MTATPGEQTPTVAQLQHDVLTVRAEQRANAVAKDDLIAREYHLLNQIDCVHRMQKRCDEHDTEMADAISALQDEISALILPQRAEPKG